MPHLSSAKNLLPTAQVSSLNSGNISLSSARTRQKSYWFANVQGSGVRIRLMGIGVDNQLNVYAGGYYGSTYGYAIKLDSLGNTSYSVYLTDSSSGCNSFYVNKSTGYAFLAGTYSPGGVMATSLSETGALRWSKYYGQGGNRIVFDRTHFRSAASTQDYFAVQSTDYSGSFVPCIEVIYQSNGNRYWSKIWNTSNNNYYPYCSAQLSSGEFLIGGGFNGDSDASLQSVQDNGGSGYSKTFDTLSNSTRRNYKALAPDPTNAGKVYAWGSTSNVSNGLVLDYFSGYSVDIQSAPIGGTWSRGIHGMNTNFTARDAVVGPDGSIYCVADDATNTRVQLVKFNSSGSIVWQQYLQTNNRSINVSGIDVDANSDMYISGYLTGGTYDEGFIIKLPGDGSKTGTYSVTTSAGSNATTLTYANTTFYEMTHNVTTTTKSWTMSDGNTTIGNTSWMASSASTTQAIKSI